MTTPALIKDPDESRVYSIDFNNLLGSGESISSISIVQSPSGLTIGTPAATTGIVQFRVSGGTAGTMYLLDAIVNTSSSNILNGSVQLLIQDTTWEYEMVTMLRFLINDLEDSPTYSDTRLRQLMVIAAQIVNQEMTFNNNYTINFGSLLISPDPTVAAYRDNAFINLCVLKAACLSDETTYRSRALLEGINARLGPGGLTVSGNLNGFMNILKVGPCKSYADLKKQYQFSDLRHIKAIFSPFVGNNFDPSYLSSTASIQTSDNPYERF